MKWTLNQLADSQKKTFYEETIILFGLEKKSSV